MLAGLPFNLDGMQAAETPLIGPGLPTPDRQPAEIARISTEMDRIPL